MVLYKCCVAINCNYSSNRSSNVNRHSKLIHSDDSGKYKFVCEKCSLDFQERNEYKQHEKLNNCGIVHVNNVVNQEIIIEQDEINVNEEVVKPNEINVNEEVVKPNEEIEVIEVIDKHELTLDIRESDGYINATKLCKYGGKNWYDYYKIQSTQKYIEDLSKEIVDLVKIQKGGNNQGTWIHPRLLNHLAMWINPNIGNQVIEIMNNKNNDKTLVELIGDLKLIEIRKSDGYVNATKMCKAYNKEWYDYYKIQTTKKYIEELSLSEPNIKGSALIKSIKGGNDKNNQGTWIHGLLAIDLARWISPKFGVQVDKLVSRYLSGNVTTQESINVNKNLNENLIIIDDINKQDEPLQITKKKSKEVTVYENNMIHNSEIYNYKFDEQLKLSPYYDSNEELIQLLYNQSKTLITSSYINKHVMYMCLTTLDVNGIALKIGYTSDIVTRFKDLMTEYNCMFLLCGLITVQNQQFEKTFHKLQQTRFPDSVCNYKIGTNNKDELYYCNKNTIDEFNALMETYNSIIEKDHEYRMEQEKTKQIEEQEKTKQIEEQEKTKQMMLEKLDRFPELIHCLLKM